MTSRERFETWFADHVVGAEVTFPDFEDGEYVESDIYDSKLYLMLQAMWMGWQEAETASEQKLTELAVQLANAESKCRELAAENAGLKRVPASDRETMLLALDAFATHGCARPDVGLQQAINVVMQRRQTPVTDAFLAEVRASAIRDALDESSDYLDTDCVMDRLDISYEDAGLRTSGAIELHDALVAVANQLRKGE